MNDGMTIGRVAAASQVPAATIRYYEQRGLLPKPPRTRAGYRIYPINVVNRLVLIRNAQSFGFSLGEIAAFLRMRDAGGKPCHTVRHAAERLLAAIDAQIADLIARRESMAQTLQSWDVRLDTTAADKRAHLLEMLSARLPRL